MTRFILRRLPSALLALFGASVFIFVILRLVPGKAEEVLAGSDATPEQVAAIREELGLDENLVVQYFAWLANILTGDLGTSYQVGGPIADLIGYGARNTLVLAFTALVVAVIAALAISITAVIVQRKWLDNIVTAINTAATALPPFIAGTLFVLLFGVTWAILPAGGTPPRGFLAEPDITVQYLALPVLTLALPTTAVLIRFLTEALHTELRQPYATTAQALGVSRQRIILRHVLPNAIPATLTVFAITVGALLGGAVLVEAIFVWPGLGMLTEEAINGRDYPLVQTLLLIAVTVFIVTQFVTDIVVAAIDPRIRLEGAS